MAYDALRAVINAYIKQNGVRAITGQILNGVLNAMVGALGEDGLVFRGRALPSTDPGTPDEDVAYLAGTAGTYTRFGGVSVGDHELALLVYDFDTATWSKETIINVGGDSPVFVAEYGSTSYQEVEDAVNHGKIVFAWMQNSDGLFLPLTSFDDENYEYYFSASFGDDRQYFALESDDTWTSGNGTYGLEKVSNRVTTLPETGSNTKYTAVQAVRTYIGLLSSLTTTDKTSIVTAINELVSGKQPLIDANNKLDYSLLSNTPVIPPAPGLLDTTLQTAQAVIANEPLSGSVKLHKISKTGSYNDLTNKPTIPSAPGTLDTTQTTAQSTSADESLSGNVKLHKVSKTGDYGDLLNTPTIPTIPVTDVTLDGASTLDGTIAKLPAYNPTGKMYVGTCATGASTATKVVSVDTFPLDANGKPVKGTLIGVKFDNTNSANAPTLDVNGTGSISIYYNASVVTSSASSYGGFAGRYNFYVYDGTYWAWVSYATDANDNTLAYNVRYNNASKTASDSFVRYRILFSSADDAQWTPATTSTSTNATSTRSVNQTKINPFGVIVYYSSTSGISAGGTPGASTLYTQYNLTLGYSFNRTGSALTLTTKTPVYIKCAPQSDGSAIIDSTDPYVQALPSTADGKIYIYLGIASSATTVELSIVHPVYYYADGQIRLWTNPDGVTDVTLGGTSVVSGGVADLPAYPSVPTISTDVVTDKADNTKTSSPKSVYDFVLPAVQSSQPVGGFAPNVLYTLGEISGAVTFLLATPADANVTNHYYWTFDTGASAPTITWPVGLSWPGGSAPTINASKHYEVSVLDGVAIAVEV